MTIISKGDKYMVKGLSKRVVVVRFNGDRVFEQAILLLRDGVVAGGVSEERVLREAGEIAAQYQRERECKSAVPDGFVKFFCGLAGAGLVCLLWLLTALS